MLRYSLRLLMLIILGAGIGMAYVTTQMQEPIDLPTRWDINSGENIKWIARLGSQSWSNPTVHGKYVFVGSNNGAGYDPLIPKKTDLGVMLCFAKATGEFLWQHSNAKLKTGRVQDWPLQGVTSQAFADGERLWYVSNRGTVVCLDTEGFRDKENDGPYRNEPTQRPIDADIIWVADLINEHGVFPHNISHSNVVVDDDHVYLKTSNGVDEGHVNLPAPNAPSFMVLDRRTGKKVWSDNAPGTSIFHGSWGSPTLTTLSGKRQILFPGGDGWLYSYEPGGNGNGRPILLWKFDCNPKTAKFELGGIGDRNNILTAPTVFEDRIYLTLGQDPEHGAGPSRVWCIEPGNKRGDLSPTIVKQKVQSKPSLQNQFRHCLTENGDTEIANANSAAVWEFTGVDLDGDGLFNSTKEFAMSRSLSRVRIADGLVYVTDLSGYLHCLDAVTGKHKWTYDAISTLWTSPLIAGENVMIFDEDGVVNILNRNQPPVVTMFGGMNPPLVRKPDTQIDMLSSMYANPVYVDGVLYLPTRTKLYAIEDPQGKNPMQKLFSR